MVNGWILSKITVKFLSEFHPDAVAKLKYLSVLVNYIGEQ